MPQTHHDTIPDFGAFPRTGVSTSQAHGLWSEASTWDVAPTDGSTVLIHHTIMVDQNYKDMLQSVTSRLGGLLYHGADGNTGLMLQTLLIDHDGGYQCGTADYPIRPEFKARLTFLDLPLDYENDPHQWGGGLIALGKVRICGAYKRPYVRLAVEPQVGSATLQLSEWTGWDVGDRLVIGDSRQLDWLERPWPAGGPHCEVVRIAAMSEDWLTVTLEAPLMYWHPACYGEPSWTPHVMCLSRNVTIRSENARGVRGHTVYTGRADVDIQNVCFGELGRTTNEEFHNAVLDGNGSVVEYGRNQQGRYRVHFHHCCGPHEKPESGSQFVLRNCAVADLVSDHNRRWGIVIHNSHYGLVDFNTVYNAAGAGIVTEDGNETGNSIVYNMTCRISSEYGQRGGRGRGGDGYWFRGPNNFCWGNIACTSRYMGFEYDVTDLGMIRVPKIQGADPEDADQWEDVDSAMLPLEEGWIDGNPMPSGNWEIYGATPHGFTLWFMGVSKGGINDRTNRGLAGTLGGVRVWHTHSEVYLAYDTHGLTIEDFQFRGDTRLHPSNWTTIAVAPGDYYTSDFTLRRADIRGCQIGYTPSGFSGGVTHLADCHWSNQTNIKISPMWSIGGGKDLPAREHLIEGNTFTPIADSWGNELPFETIGMYYQVGGNLIQSDVVQVTGYQGDPAVNFRVYYYEQQAGFILPPSEGALVASPEAGLSNQELWDKYAVAMAGAVAPPEAAEIANVRGLVVPSQ